MRIGFDKIVGYVEGGFEAVKQEKVLPIVPVQALNDSQFVQIAQNKDNFVLDIRSKIEAENGKAQNA